MNYCVLTRSFSLLALAATLAVTLATPVAAQHQDRGRHAPPSQWHGGNSYGGYRNRDDSGAIVGGALLGLGLGALLGGALVAPPPAAYASPPYYYYNNGPPPYYAYPYAPPPPVYYGY
jgi:hypothetical protein